ncbi:MAG: phosphatase PAP2 family protein [Candidatus Marinimicrobia bacterium]|nr:phosphatase PAP2 family protein [Candidatus Neomarinimicrobiota bacterium]
MCSLRIEEVIALVFIIPTLMIRVYAFLDLSDDQSLPGMGRDENLWWIALISILTIWFFAALLSRAENKIFKVMRDFAPFLFVIAIFANIQVLIYYVNPHDFHFALQDLEQWIFGNQPTVRLERIVHPLLTEWFAFSYMSYYWITLVLLIMLYVNKQEIAFRKTMFTMIISYYLGFLGYVLFPAASPYLVIPHQYTVDIWKNTSVCSELAQWIVSLSPVRTRDAFPSMHNSITLLTMIMAWRYHRPLFWVFLPLAISLPVATLYLRYHFAVDVLAGVGVTFLALYLSPLLESWWTGVQSERENLQGVDESMDIRT